MADLRQVGIEPTNRCNLKCGMCFSRGNRPEGDMSMSLFDKIVSELKTINTVKMVSLNFGGEPLLHPQFIEMVKKVSGNGWGLGFATNGTLLTPKISMALVKHQFTGIDISVDSGIPEKLSRLRPGAKLRVIKKNMETLAKMKEVTGSESPGIGINMLITEKSTIDDIASVMIEFGQITDRIRILPATNPDMTWNPRVLEMFSKHDDPNDKWCDSPNKYMGILWNGDVVPCCDDISCKTVMGNIAKSSSIKKVWEGSFYKKLREHQDYFARCSKCTIWKDKRGINMTKKAVEQ